MSTSLRASARPSSTSTHAHTSTCTLEVRPGEGGEDAERFAAELLGAACSYAERLGLAVDSERSEGRTLRASLRGREDAHEKLRSLVGVHRIQRVPVNSKRGRRHTSTASLAVLDAREETQIALAEEDLVLQTYRGTGAGGQKRNKTSSAVRLRHVPSGIVVTREHGRSLTQNIEDARRDIIEQLRARAQQAELREVNEARLSQVAASDRSAKSFTHNTQRDESVCHEDGRTWRLQAFMRGRIS